MCNVGLAEGAHREVDLGERAWPISCMLHGRHIRHQHLQITISTLVDNAGISEGDDAEPEYFGTFLGALEVFGYNDSAERAYLWSPRPYSPESAGDEETEDDEEQHKQWLAKIKTLKRAGRLAAIYFPLKLFGASPCVGLSWQQRQLHTAITRELTRQQGKGRCGRPDKAEIMIGGQKPDDRLSSGVAPCPYLEQRVHYVGFNGN